MLCESKAKNIAKKLRSHFEAIERESSDEERERECVCVCVCFFFFKTKKSCREIVRERERKKDRKGWRRSPICNNW